MKKCRQIALSSPARQFSTASLLLVVLFCCEIGSAWAGAYHGQVVDAETGKPIEGAVVVVEWHKKDRVALIEAGSSFHNAKETLTDAEGKFSLDSSRGIDWNPFTYIQYPPRIIAFYPGYRPFSPAHPEDIGIKGGLGEIEEAFKRGVIVKLRKLNSEKEQRYFTSKGSFGPVMAPYAMIPNLLRVINAQRKMLGMQELSIP